MPAKTTDAMIGIKCPAELKERLRTIAEKHGVSMSDVGRMGLAYSADQIDENGLFWLMKSIGQKREVHETIRTAEEHGIDVEQVVKDALAARVADDAVEVEASSKKPTQEIEREQVG